MSKPGTNDMMNGHSRTPERFGQYKIVDFLGKGAVGKVYKGADMNTGDLVAMKVVDLHAMQVEDLGDVQNEVKLLKRFQHANIVNYVDALRTDTHLCIVLEFMESGSLAQFITRLFRVPDKELSKKKKRGRRAVTNKGSFNAMNGSASRGVGDGGGVHNTSSGGSGGSGSGGGSRTPRQTSAEARFLELKNERLETMIDMDQHEQLVAGYTCQLLMALEYLHQEGIIHRDIKAANVLLGRNGMVKVADFGVATKLANKTGAGLNMDVVGTPYWMAPEIIEMVGEHTTAVDIWSVGCTVIELLTGNPPYFDLQQMPAMFRIVHDDHPPFPSTLSPAAVEFLLQCFCKNPRDRPTATELLKHPWLAPHVVRVQAEINKISAPDEVGTGEVEIRYLAMDGDLLKEKSIGLVDCDTNVTLQVLRRKVEQELDHVPERFSFVYNFAFPGVTAQSLPAAVVRSEVEKFQRARHCLHNNSVRLCDVSFESSVASGGDGTNDDEEEEEEEREATATRRRAARRDAYKRSQSVGRPSSSKNPSSSSSSSSSSATATASGNADGQTPSAERQQRARVLYNLLKSQQASAEDKDNQRRGARRGSRRTKSPRNSDSDSANSSDGPQNTQSLVGNRASRPRASRGSAASSYSGDGLRRLQSGSSATAAATGTTSTKKLSRRPGPAARR